MWRIGSAVEITLALALACSRDPTFRGQLRVVCSRGIDDKLEHVAWPQIERAMTEAVLTRGVVAFHAHVPGITVSNEAIEHLLDLAAAHDLPTLTFRELARRRVQRPAILLAFDDNSPTEWEAVAELLARRGVHATFFVTEWDRLTDAQHAALHRLAGAGHDIEPHGRDHVHAPAYARDHGVLAYMIDEVMPSAAALRADGFEPPTTFAYPYGEHTAELDAALLGRFALVRVGAGHCPR